MNRTIEANPSANFRWQTNVDGLSIHRKVNRLAFWDATYDYYFYLETPVDNDGASDYFAYLTLKEEMIDDIKGLNIICPDLIFPFDGHERELPDDAYDCGAVTAGEYLY